MLRLERSLQNNNSSLEHPSGTGTEISLALGKVNLLVLTDVHSWIGGHERHEPWMNVDYGDVVGFYEHLKDIIRGSKRDLFMVMNGDFLDGTGLSTNPPKHLTPLLEDMPFSIVNLGNHELYDDKTVDWIMKEFIPHWGGNYLTSNTILKATGEPLGNRYTHLKGDYSTLLVFGFLYNFQGHCPSTIVEQVQDVVRQEWFIEVLKRQDDYDAILVMAHMHVTDPLVDVIRVAIRQLVGPQMPIQFITGHTHVRAFAQLDKYSASFEAGRFLDTIGFCSFPIKDKLYTPLHPESVINEDDDSPKVDKIDRRSDSTLHTPAGNASSGALPTKAFGFEHVFLEPNRQWLSSTLALLRTSGQPDLDSSDGLALRKRIFDTQEHLRLNTVIGCSSRTYELDQAMNQPHSLWGLYMYEIVPSLLFGSPAEEEAAYKNHQHPHSPSRRSKQIFVQGTAAFRYKLFEGTVSLDDVISVCPFNDTIHQVALNLTGQQILQVLNVTTKYPNEIISQTSKYNTLPLLAISTNQPIDSGSVYDLFTSHFHLADMVRKVKDALGHDIPDTTSFMDHGRNHPGIIWTTTNLWQTYIEQEWPCTEESTIPKSFSTLPKMLSSPTNDSTSRSDTRYAHRRPDVAQGEQPITVIFFIALIVCGLYAYQKRKECLERAGYVPIGDPTMTLLRSSTGSRSNLSYE